MIFISYRRNDSRASAGRLSDWLLRSYKQSEIFMDIDSIAPGEDFVLAIEKAVGKCDVLLAVIGKNWLQMNGNRGERMLDNPEDFVRTEIRAALQRNIRVIPVLVDNAEMPPPEQLPEDIRLLSRRNAIKISHEQFNIDVERLVKSLKGIPTESDKRANLKKKSTVRGSQKQLLVENELEKQVEEKKRSKEQVKIKPSQAEKVKPNPNGKDSGLNSTEMTFFQIIFCSILFGAGAAVIISAFMGFDSFWSIAIGAVTIFFVLILIGNNKK
jgi:hypothetical protein